MRIYSWYNPPVEKFKETFPNPSLTSQLDYEPLSKIIERFIAHDTVPPVMDGDVNVDDLSKPKAVDEAFAHLEGTDTSSLSAVEQAEVLATAERLVEQLQAQQAKQSDKSAISAPGTQGQKASATADPESGENANKA